MRKRIGFKSLWSKELAYIVGLITTDGNLSSDGRHINLTSKDIELIQYTKDILNLNNKISKKGSGSSTEKKYYFLQFGNIDFYNFLLKIGLTPNKSKILNKVVIPKKFFFDFLRGCIDGDGSITVSKHPESIHPQLKIRLCSASGLFVTWIKKEIQVLLKIKTGWVYTNKTKSIHTLTYAKADSLKILEKMYSIKNRYFLRRKYVIVDEIYARVV